MLKEKGSLRKKDQECRQALLSAAHRIECEEGVEAISIRRLASEAHIATGTVYNYFENKQEVLLELTEEYWRNALLEMRESITQTRFSDQIRQMIAFLRTKMNDCAAILMRSLRMDEENGRVRMAAMQLSLQLELTERLEQDEAIRPDVWNERFTKETFSAFVLSNLLILLQKKDDDSEILFAIIERILYEQNQ